MSPEVFEKHNISVISYNTLADETAQVYPISVNGVTITRMIEYVAPFDKSDREQYYETT